MSTHLPRTLDRLEAISKSPLRIPVLPLVILGLLALLSFVAAAQHPELHADMSVLF